MDRDSVLKEFEEKAFAFIIGPAKNEWIKVGPLLVNMRKTIHLHRVGYSQIMMPTLEVGNFEVSPGFRRRGIWSGALTVLERCASQQYILIRNVIADNDSMQEGLIAFLRSRGYEKFPFSQSVDKHSPSFVKILPHRVDLRYHLPDAIIGSCT